MIADGDSVSISAQVLKNTFGAVEGRFAIDDPVLVVEVFSEGFEVSGIFEMTETVGVRFRFPPAHADCMAKEIVWRFDSINKRQNILIESSGGIGYLGKKRRV